VAFSVLRFSSLVGRPSILCVWGGGELVSPVDTMGFRVVTPLQMFADGETVGQSITDQRLIFDIADCVFPRKPKLRIMTSMSHVGISAVQGRYKVNRCLRAPRGTYRALQSDRCLVITT
jgi:hypothetical protein